MPPLTLAPVLRALPPANDNGRPAPRRPRPAGAARRPLPPEVTDCARGEVLQGFDAIACVWADRVAA